MTDDVDFESYEQPAWLDRTAACRYFGLTDDDDGWDALNEIVLEFEIDAELGEVGDVLRINSNDPGMADALFVRHEREVGHRPDDSGRIKKARRALIAAEDEKRRGRESKRRSELGKRVALRKRTTKGRMQE
jgi:hypothetical protein